MKDGPHSVGQGGLVAPRPPETVAAGSSTDSISAKQHDEDTRADGHAREKRKREVSDEGHQNEDRMIMDLAREEPHAGADQHTERDIAEYLSVELAECAPMVERPS